METKDLLTRSIDEISTLQLSKLHSAIISELDSRRLRIREAAWDKLVDTIKDYTNTFGGIYVTTEGGTFCMDSLDDYSSIGEIQINFGWWKDDYSSFSS